MNTDDASFSAQTESSRWSRRRGCGYDIIYLSTQELGKLIGKFDMVLASFLKQRLNTSHGDLLEPERLFLIRAGVWREYNFVLISSMQLDAANLSQLLTSP